ncbi:SDR family NAD(P)-dependent oxidoreductase [Paracoccus siganidrum]|uniref:SDR family oxidoreductase n=1 Tax=Paracoccus siganidrum TaxID=1276757 RepID=A0A419AAZ2_9RHOB|nr:SDR family oxidoreductase [Paracoccus siganidrum]RJL20434.1 SDR family oxidoreductase [Paracoccus siganidrum]RMC39225.1 oxidoreductase [Paracoccus siganidrum]
MDQDEGQPANTGRRRLLGAVALGTVIGASTGLAGGAALTAPGAPPARVTCDGSRRFAGKVVMITGATSGIGRAAAEAFAAEGARVAFCGRREELGAEVEHAIRRDGGDALYVRADVRNPAEIDDFVARAIEAYGGLDIALNNAGISFSKPLHETEPDEWDDLQDTNVRGVFLAMRAQIPRMLARGGQIIVTSSVNIVGARPGLGAYNASKRALAGLIQTAALEYADRGIRVNGICPGATDTEMIRRQAGFMDAPDAAWRTAVGLWARGNVHGLQRVAAPHEIAAAILAMASPEMTYLNGSMFFVDGGMTASL